MSSDEEDFNDIYGDDEPSTTVEENKHIEAGAETIKEHKEDYLSASPTSSSENNNNNNNNNNSNVTEDVSSSNNNNVSSLDQLAALQALSSNLNQINNNSDNTNKDVSSNSNDSNVNSDNNNNNTALPWEQLQQTMSQFNPQQNTQEDTNGTQKHVKADISKDNCKMFIGGLNWETTEEGLRNYFNKYGHVIDLKIMKDPNTGRSRGFGFLTFESPSSVDEVVKTQHILDGKVIDPKRSIPREEQDKTGKIFVGGIGADVRPKEFEEFFAKYGTIIDAQLMLDKDTGRSRGFGFVTYDSPEAVDRVCQNKYIEFKGKQIEIKRAEPRHLQKGQYGGANPNNRNTNNYGSNSMHMGTGANSIAMNPNAAAAAAMYQNPMMMTGFNPMMPGFNPQAMQEYYQKMQEYYQQMQQQTGIDYTQMYQQQMQQMAMMMPGFAMPTQQPQTGSQSPSSGSQSVDNNGSNSTDVQTIGENNDMKNTTDINGDNSNIHNNNNSNNSGSSSNMDRDNKGSHDSKSNTPDLNIPRGPRDPSSIPSHGGYPHRERGDRGDRRGRRSDRGGYRGGSGNNYRGSRSGYNRRNNNGYHPYNR